MWRSQRKKSKDQDTSNKYLPQILPIHINCIFSYHFDLKLIYTEKFYKWFRNIFTKKVYGVRIILVSHTKSMIPMMFRGTIKIFLLCWYLSISYKPANFKTSSTTTDYITGYCRSHFITDRSVTQQDADFSCFIISSFTCDKNLRCLGLVERI